MEDQTRQLTLFAGMALEEFEQGKDELNMAEYPLGLPGKTITAKRQGGNSFAQFSDTIRDKGTGQLVNRIITISSPADLGLPTYYDEEVLFGVLQLTHLRRRPDGSWPKELAFTRYQLAKLLGLKPTGSCYQRLRESLLRLQGTTHRFEFAFRDKRGEAWLPDTAINFIQDVSFDAGRRGDPEGRGEVTITWNDKIHRSFEAGYLRDINFLEYRAMKLPVAKALYRFLGKHFYRQRRLSFDLRNLAHEKLGLSRKYDAGQVKRALEPAIGRLEERGYIEPMAKAERYEPYVDSDGRKSWKVHFELARKATSELPEAGQHLTPTDLEKQLVSQKVSRAVAAELVADYPAELIERKLDTLAWELKRGGATIKSRGGYLAKSIRDGWADPDGYESPEIRAERAANVRKQEMQDEARAKAEKAAEDERGRLHAKQQKTVKARYDAMSQEERAELRQAVEQGVSAKLLKDGKTDRREMFELIELTKRMTASGDVEELK